MDEIIKILTIIWLTFQIVDKAFRLVRPVIVSITQGAKAPAP